LLSRIPRKIEVIIADDGTLPSFKKKLHPEIKLYTHEHLGNRVSTCRNKGAELATRKKILFLDDDVEPHNLCFAAHSLALEMFDISLGLLPQNKWEPYSDERMLFFIHEDQALWNWGWTGSLAIRNKVFWEIGGFDEDTFNGTPDTPAAGYEDIDFCRRAFLMEKRMHLNRLAMAWHQASHTSANPNPGTLRNMEQYNQKWGEL
jgi:GT2 family glycosyltransferase